MSYKCINESCSASKLDIVYSESWVKSLNSNGVSGLVCTSCGADRVEHDVKVSSTGIQIKLKGTGWPTQDSKNSTYL